LRTALTLILVVLVAAVTAGCGPNCQTTCSRLYGTTGDACGITRQATTETELMNTCMEKCEYALDHPGEVGSYNPDERQGSSAPRELETDKQAALWMDCIAETACEDLLHGYCAPIW
jgi:hypothetical protein